jgi:hypothetical protein
MSYDTQTEEAATQWLTKHRFVSDPQTLARIVWTSSLARSTFGGYISAAHFERAYLELVRQGEIKPFRGTCESQQRSAFPQDVIDYIESSRTSAWELQRKYKTDAVFRAHHDRYEKLKASKQGQQGSSTLTVEQYRSLPAPSSRNGTSPTEDFGRA